MPSINRRICTIQGHGIYSGKRCPKCEELRVAKKKDKDKDYDKEKRNKERKKFYNSAVWRRLRNTVLMREPICRVCKRVEAQAVDHIMPISQGGEKLSMENLQPICYSCHSKKSLREKNIYYPGWMPKPKCKITLVCGAIGAGKNNYIDEHKSDDDVVIDLDSIKQKLTGKDMYQWEPKEMLDESIKERNKQLFNLSLNRNKDKRVWFIVSAPTAKAREFWADKLQADIIFISATREQCRERILNDSRRDTHREFHLSIMNQWFEKYTRSKLDNYR